jgi:hypothetical protein
MGCAGHGDIHVRTDAPGQAAPLLRRGIGNKSPSKVEQVARPALPAGALLLAPLQEFAEQRLAVGLALRRGARA